MSTKIYFAFITSLTVILTIAIIYRNIRHKFASHSASPVTAQHSQTEVINNSLTDECGDGTTLANAVQQTVNEMTVISMPSYAFTVDDIIIEEEELTASDQCPDVVDCSRVPSRARHVFITTDAYNKWDKNNCNAQSLDDIRLYGNDNSTLKVWTTNASASMELMECTIEGNVIYV